MVYLHGIGHFHPETVLDNELFESLGIDTNNQWIMQRVGIEQRRSILPLSYIKDTHNQDLSQAKQHMQYTSAQTGAFAAKMALERAGLTANDIGMVIAGSCSPRYSLPANAAVLADELGIDGTVLDVNSACSSFAAHMHLINSMQAEAIPDYVLLVIPENWTTTINYRDRKTAVLIGDCSVATVVSLKHPARVSADHTLLISNPSGWGKVLTPTAEYFSQDGPAVQRFAIKKTVSLIETLREKGNLHPEAHYFIGHQANLMMLKSVCRMAKVAEHHHLYNVHRYGNCGAAGAPSVLSQRWEQLQSGDNIILGVVGAGLSWGGMVLRVK